MNNTRQKIFKALLLIFSVLFLYQCDSESEPATPQERFSKAEANVLKNGLKTTYRATSTGSYKIDLSGAFELVPGEQLRWTSSGNFGGREVVIELRANADSVFYENQVFMIAQPRPKHLDEAIVKGLFRMGIMHNLAVLSSGKLPDHGGSRSIDAWLATDFSESTQPSDTLLFDVVVNGNSTAKARLVLDENERPLYRWQHVEMGGGMTVEERFEYH